MAELDIEVDNNLVEGLKRLAVRHYGDSDDTSVGRVVEAALEMRLLWLDLVKGGGNEIDEPLARWEFADNQPEEQAKTEIRGWLFRRR